MKKILPLIEQVILKGFPDVMDVTFKNGQSYLGSSPELPEEERTIDTISIVVTFNNLKGDLPYSKLTDQRSDIKKKVESIFNLNHMMYGSGWDFAFYQAKIERL